MEYTHLILRVGEIFLKGKNRGLFENKLISNTKKITSLTDIQNGRGRLITKYCDGHVKLRRVFGINSYSPAVFVEKDINAIKQCALEFFSGSGAFKVNTKRSDKRFPIQSPQVNVLVGQFVEENTDYVFSLDSPDIILNVEINQYGVFLYVDSIKCFGGLPVGVERGVAVLIDSKASLLAGLLLMRRGVLIKLYAFCDFDISLLEMYCPTFLSLSLVSDVSEIVEDVLVVGDTFDSLKKYDYSGIVLRPLIAYDSEKVNLEISNYRQV